MVTQPPQYPFGGVPPFSGVTASDCNALLSVIWNIDPCTLALGFFTLLVVMMVSSDTLVLLEFVVFFLLGEAAGVWNGTSNLVLLLVQSALLLGLT